MHLLKDAEGEAGKQEEQRGRAERRFMEVMKLDMKSEKKRRQRI